MRKFNRNLFPPGGRYFVDEDGVTHKADQWEHLAVRLASYRKRANKPAGNPMEEIMAQVCARLPEYCSDTAPVVPRAAPPRPAPTVRENAGNLTDRVMKWFAEMLRQKRATGVNIVSAEEAKRRAAICAACPQQRDVSSVCGSCKRTRRSAGDALLGAGKRVNKGLRACLALGIDTSIAVHLELPPSGAALPGHCWRRG